MCTSTPDTPPPPPPVYQAPPPAQVAEKSINKRKVKTKDKKGASSLRRPTQASPLGINQTGTGLNV